jgi:hypothetical protein
VRGVSADVFAAYLNTATIVDLTPILNLLLLFAASETYTTNQTITEHAFIDCAFLSCRSLANGGAILVANTGINLTLVACQFTGCRSAGSGAAVYAGTCGVVAISRACAITCSAADQGIFVTSNVTIHDSAVSSSSCGHDTLAFIGPTSVAFSLNATFNSVSSDGAAVAVGANSNVSVHFGRFCENVGSNCLFFDQALVGTDIANLWLINNTNDVLVFAESTVEIRGCVLSGNFVNSISTHNVRFASFDATPPPTPERTPASTSAPAGGTAIGPTDVGILVGIVVGSLSGGALIIYVVMKIIERKKSKNTPRRPLQTGLSSGAGDFDDLPPPPI